MRQLRWKSIAYATTAIWLGAAMPAHAQNARVAGDDTSVNDINDIVVTARRMEERLQDVPISITVFTPQDLAKRNITNPADLALYTPSLASNRQYGTEKSSFSIRGFAQELYTQPSVAVYFADVAAPRANGPTPSGNGTLPGTLFDLQNVQVLKGPQGTLFGRNTTGGAVLFVPQKPTDKLEGYVEGSIGDFDMRRVQAVVNIPLADTFRVRLSVDRMKRDGYLRNRSGIGPKDFGNVNYWGARASIVAELTPTLENYTIATYNLSKTHGTLPKVIACARNIAQRFPEQVFADPACAQIDRQAARGDGFYDVENTVPNPQVRLQQWQVINTTTWKASDTLTIKNIASYAEFRDRTRINLVGDNLQVQNPTRLLIGPLGQAGGLLLPLPAGPLTGLPFHLASIEPGPSGYNTAQRTFVEELQLQGRSADERLIWQAGGYIEISQPLRSGTQLNTLVASCTNAAAFQCIAPVSPFQLGGGLSLLDQRFRYRNLAAYGQATYKITDQISLTGGIRYTSDRTTAITQGASARLSLLAPPTFSCSNTLVPIASFAARGACEQRFSIKSSRPTWLIDLDYKPDRNILLYAKYSRGYRQGTINLLPFGDPLKFSRPEKVDSYEIGAKTSFEGPVPGYFNISAFYNDFRDQQIQANTIVVPNSGAFPISVLVNAEKSRIQGLELDTSLRPFTGFRLDVAYAYLDTKLQNITPPAITGVSATYYQRLVPTALVGGPLVYSPKNRVTVTGTYTLPLDESIGRLSVGATFTHTDKQFATHADDAYVSTIGGFNPGLLPATNLLNLNLDWTDLAGLPFDCSLFATNVTQKKYRLGVFNLLQAGYEAAVLGEPRMYGARLRYRFGN